MNTPNLTAEIEQAFREMFARSPARQLLASGPPGWTRAIKKTLGDLGTRLECEVAASGYSEASQGEFLYDMVWYKTDSDGFVLSQPVALESEWDMAPLTVVDDDFQKLVQARADVRVWVSNCRNASEFATHVDNCKKQVRLFNGSCRETGMCSCDGMGCRNPFNREFL